MSPATDTPHIVVVEDSDDDFDTVREAVRLSSLSVDLRRVSNCDERLALLRRGGAEQPAFVMVDLSKPGADGRHAPRQIKADSLLKTIPAVVVTASADPRDVDYCDQSGADAHHVKPISYPDHLQVLTGLLDDRLVKVLKPAAQRLAP